MSSLDFLNSHNKLMSVLRPPSLAAYFNTYNAWEKTLYSPMAEFAAIPDVRTIAGNPSLLATFESIAKATEVSKAALPYTSFKGSDFYKTYLEGSAFSFRNYDFLDGLLSSIPSMDENDVDKNEEQEVLEEVVHATVVEQTKTIQRIITDIYNNNAIIHLIGSREFEEMVAELLYYQGYKVDLTKQTRDNGYDILAVKTIDGFPLKFLVECKRYREDRKVGVDIIRSFKEVIVTENANKGIIATTSYFTRDAQIKKEQSPYILDFRDKNDLIGWVSNYQNR